MFVEITGAGFANKGAEIMLRTVVAELTRAIPGVRCCMRPTAPYDRLPALGLRPILGLAPRHRRNPLRSALGDVLNRLVPRGFCDQHNIVHPFDVDALIDIAGYAYGDKFSLKPILKLADHARWYHRRGKPVVMLPQMFGPFEKPGFATAMANALRYVDLAYAREPESLRHLQQAAGTRPGIQLAPDITIFTEPYAGEMANVPATPFCCVVPNVRMVDLGAAEWGGDYLRLLSRGILQSLNGGLDVVILIHSTGGGDHELAARLMAEIPAASRSRCRVHTDEDPLKLKAYLWRSSLVIGSRFHSLVGALSGGVPVVMMGWAHKYLELARDFGVEDFLVKPEEAGARMPELIRRLLDTNERERLRQVLVAKKAAMKLPNQAMWQETVACLTRRRA